MARAKCLGAEAPKEVPLPSLAQIAKEAAERPAVILGAGGHVESFGELEARFRRIALQKRKLRPRY